MGSWGICFTYATQFALESLSLVGETYETSESARRACEFLISKQRADGGWGESYKVRPECYVIHLCLWFGSLVKSARGWNTPIHRSSKPLGLQWP